VEWHNACIYDVKMKTRALEKEEGTYRARTGDRLTGLGGEHVGVMMVVVKVRVGGDYDVELPFYR
jgi:hypothetical protein